MFVTFVIAKTLDHFIQNKFLFHKKLPFSQPAVPKSGSCERGGNNFLFSKFPTFSIIIILSSPEIIPAEKVLSNSKVETVEDLTQKRCVSARVADPDLTNKGNLLVLRIRIRQKREFSLCG